MPKPKNVMEEEIDVNCITLNDLRRGLSVVNNHKLVKMTVSTVFPNRSWVMSINDPVSVDSITFHEDLDVTAVVLNVDTKAPRSPALAPKTLLEYMDIAEKNIKESEPETKLDEVVFLVRICLENGEEQTLIPYQVMPTRGFGIGVLNLQFLCIRPENLMH